MAKRSQEGRVRDALIWGACLGAASGAIAIHNAGLYVGGLRHGHFQVVDWVQKNVPPGTWVGAIQTLTELESTNPGLLSPHRYLAFIYFSGGEGGKYAAELRTIGAQLNDAAILAQASIAPVKSYGFMPSTTARAKLLPWTSNVSATTIVL